MELEGKRLLVSGATGGLGRAIADQLAGHGARLVLSSRREEELGDVARNLPGGTDRHAVLVADLADEGAAQRVVDDAGDLDGLIANAALPGVGSIEKVAAEELTRTLRVNLEAPMLMARELVPSLMEKGEGRGQSPVLGTRRSGSGTCITESRPTDESSARRPVRRPGPRRTRRAGSCGCPRGRRG